tara:strand:- start:217 stop:420 length:204 start_codon:yes stop_codon:yes gene_type:complete
MDAVAVKPGRRRETESQIKHKTNTTENHILILAVRAMVLIDSTLLREMRFFDNRHSASSPGSSEGTE